jgi:DNA-binding transcriptional ArsR family regulator
VSEGADGSVLLHCHAGCSPEQIVAAIGLTMSDLFPKPSATHERKIVATYPYHDAEGKLLFEVVRYEPKDFRTRRPDGNGGYVYNLDGVPRVLYRLPEVLEAIKRGKAVYIVEGEKDVESLRALGLTATTNPHGAGKWRPDYSEALRDAHAVIIPDKDEPGRKHAETVARSLHGVAASVKLLELPGQGKDVTEWLAAGGTKEKLLELADQAPVWQPAPKMSYAQLKETFARWLYLPDDTPLRFILCAVIANRLPGDPFWAFLIGPSGSSKTELLNSLSGLDFVKPIDTLTTSTFLSGKQRKDPQASLLLRVPYGTIFLMRDFTSVLEMHREKRAEIFAQLRKIYDGHLTKCTGEGGESADLVWEGKVGLIAGVTPAIEGYRAFATTLGERFLYYYLPVLDRGAAAQQALHNRENLPKMRAELRKTVRDFINGLTIPEHVDLPNEIAQWIVNIADFVSVARTGVARDHYSSAREITDLPDPEVPTRLAQQLGALACAHAVLHDRAAVTDEDLALVAETALACIPQRRRFILKLLAEAGAAMETAEIAEAVDLPTVTARRDLEDLTALGLAKRIKVGEGRADLWQVTDLAVKGWSTLTRSDGRVTVQNPVPVLKEGTLSEKSVSVCKGEAKGEIEGGMGSVCSIGDVSDKVADLASGTEKPTVTQTPDELTDD